MAAVNRNHKQVPVYVARQVKLKVRDWHEPSLLSQADAPSHKFDRLRLR